MTNVERAVVREIVREVLAEAGPDLAKKAAYCVLEARGPEVAREAARGLIREAVANVGSDDIAFMHLSQVYPLHPDVGRRIREAEHVVLVEGNATAQLGRLIRSETGLDIADRLLKYSGLQFSVEEVSRHLEGVLRGVG